MSDKKFSILIPSWNNLAYLKLCVESIRENSFFEHQIIVHVNEGKDGTLEWVKQQGLDYTQSPKNVGVCFAMNMMRTLVKTDYICFVNDDMYMLPDWDKPVAEEIDKLNGDKFFYISTSTIQPHHEYAGVCTLADYGDSTESFRKDDLLKDYKKFFIKDWQGSTWPPCIVHRDLWDIVGGYSIELSPGMGSDHDFAAKLYFAGVRHFIGLGNSLAYHFEQKSTAVVKKNHYQSQFLFKWGIKNSTLRKYITRVGQPWEGAPHEADEKEIAKESFFGWLKAIVYVFSRKFGTQRKLWEKA